MATLKCLACGHDNNVGDEWCSSCSSSLNLRLCSACEAINASDAERCHSCKAEFRIEPEVVTFEMDPLPREQVQEAALAVKALPAVWRLATEQARKPRARSATVVMVLPLLAAAAAYYFYAAPHAVQAPQVTPPHAAPMSDGAQKSEPEQKPNPEVVPEPVRPHVAETRAAQVPAASVRIAHSKTAAASTKSPAVLEPRRTTAPVTHTRGAGADAPGRTVAAEPSSKATAADAPAKTAVTTLPAAAASGPAASAAILPVSERVTHTKADQTESAVMTAAPAAAAQGRTVPAEGRTDEPAGCPPAVAALALCGSR